MKRKFSLVLFVFLLVFTPAVLAQADDLIVDLSSQRIDLILTGEKTVLAATTEPKREDKKETPKSVQLVPANSPSTIRINSTQTSDKKVNVTITSKPNKPEDKSKVIKENVDQVVAQGAAGQTVFKVKPDPGADIILEQGRTQVSTNLSLQIDTQTHQLSAVVDNQPTNLSLLPSEALIAAGVAKPKLSLVSDRKQLLYKISGQKNLDLFGLWSLTLPVTVDVSAQTGSVSHVSQSPLFSLFGQ